MKNKINIAELLKDCLRGMELDCTICNGAKFIELNRNPNFPIVVRANNGYEFSLTKYGQVHNIDDAKCVIFPKGKTTWDGFQRPFKDGDVVTYKYENGLVSMILNKFVNFVEVHYHCALYDNAKGFVTNNYIVGEPKYTHLATEEEKQKLFDAIKANGYKWNAETKTLEELPKFKVGDRIKLNKSKFIYTITDLLKDRYRATTDSHDLYEIEFERQDAYKLVPNKFDITTLKPFDKVLVAHKKGEWHIQFFEKYSPTSKFPFICIGGSVYQKCVPYEENKHLMDTTNDCDEFYKTWI